MIQINARPDEVTLMVQVHGRSVGPSAKDSDVTEAVRSKVAIVDDDQAVHDSLQFLLEVMGHPVETFASAAEFLKSDIRHLACLIPDNHMPHMTGLELAARLRVDGAGIADSADHRFALTDHTCSSC